MKRIRSFTIIRNLFLMLVLLFSSNKAMAGSYGFYSADIGCYPSGAGTVYSSIDVNNQHFEGQTDSDGHSWVGFAEEYAKFNGTKLNLSVTPADNNKLFYYGIMKYDVGGANMKIDYNNDGFKLVSAEKTCTVTADDALGTGYDSYQEADSALNTKNQIYQYYAVFSHIMAFPVEGEEQLFDPFTLNKPGNQVGDRVKITANPKCAEDTEVIWYDEDGNKLKSNGEDVLIYEKERMLGVPVTGIKRYYAKTVRPSEAPKVTINAKSQMATFSNRRAIKVPDDVTIYYAPEIPSSTDSNPILVLKRFDGNVVPADMGVVLYKPVDKDEEITLEYSDVSPAAPKKNLFQTTSFYERTINNYAVKGLKVSNENNKFYGLSKSEGKFLGIEYDLTVPMGKAVIEMPGTFSSQVGLAKVAVMLEGQMPTAIKNIDLENDDLDAAEYNLAGQKVGKNYKGIVINKSKKVVKK